MAGNEEKQFNLIPLTEYAKNHGRALSSVQQKARRGGFKTTVKMGRDWFIDADEPYIDYRKRDQK